MTGSVKFQEAKSSGLYPSYDSHAIARRSDIDTALRLVKGLEDVECGPTEFVVLSLMRDAESWLPSYFDHFDRLRPRHYFILDNGSSDRTISILEARCDVTILSCELPFDRYSVDFFKYLLWRFGGGRWALLVDQDERFDYPGSGRVRMPQLLEYLNKHAYDAVRTYLIDMFSELPLNLLPREPGKELKKIFGYCDLSDLWANEDPYREWNEGPGREFPLLTGGIRKSVFGTDRVLLSCHSLIYDAPTKPLPDGHCIAGARIADFTAMLWHYKFTASFEERNADLLKRWGAETDSDSQRNIRGELDAYARVYSTSPGLTLMRKTAIRVDSADELLLSGILRASDSFTRWIGDQLGS